ncbi:Polyphosphate:ADP phosphotransferase [Beijerinckiaceae bacterium RH AL1]|nr:polyphosphate kinase 2 family protein [Beijerinckiaceae bacterium]VVB48699.1 Polyphosphate:ADP phosphotransferase [Beijerinckiaceae bacterium RH CH11]VVB48780.1 Polyphosphate:ADP phosphotransferase [Beijerinckiaceae bacterium RH AL8]VVC56524.1 Polyphosphate:ADP phosphotransferase [Beijerinckiaceae bacterium RH AL1]
MSGEDEIVRDAKAMREVLARYRVASGGDFELDAYATDDLPDGMPHKTEAKALLAQGTARLAELQELLYANRTWSLLVVLQAMDAGGKDSTIAHVMSGVNPQGVSVVPFKAPGPHELAHGFLWRVGRVVPARGMIGIFNRSHYEDVLVARVHEDRLPSTGLPPELIGGKHFWEHRLEDIAAFERYLERQGTRIVKIFLNVGRDEQKERFLKRLEEPEKTWKFDAADLAERKLWPAYRAAYQAAIAATATKSAPWYVVPADRKWFARLVVAEAIIAALEDLELKPPAVPKDHAAQLAKAREQLLKD